VVILFGSETVISPAESDRFKAFVLSTGILKILLGSRE